MPPAGFELTIPASERPNTDALDRAATGIGQFVMYTAGNILGMRTTGNGALRGHN